VTGPLSAPELLSATGLHHVYRRLAAVDDVDMHLAPGARHALVGPNGAGKTTLLHLLAGTLRPSGGRIVFAGRDITHLKPAQRARLGIARTFQHPAILDSLSTLDNVVVAAWRHTGGRAPWGPVRYRSLVGHCRHQLAQLGLADVAAQAAGTLSHGTRRLLELAMALAARPRLLLLDEPAAGLEDADLQRLQAVLRGLPPETAVVLVEHNLDLVTAVADTVTVLHDGRVLATGSPDDIAADPTVREVYLGTPVDAVG
jgi:ABC-type branched-subunit amino acid transport system ATPase component